jgi:uncharacterized repeat protein (TIGR01451 family)/CSLREA domain-containing protein
LLASLLIDASPALALPPAADYFQINVDPIATPADDADSGAGGACTLRDAIAAANASAPAGLHADGCTVTAVGPATTDYVILIPGSYTYTLNGAELLVALTPGDNLYLVGASAASSIIQADPCNPVTLPGGCTPATYRALRVNAAAGSLLEINNLTLRHGRCVGACTSGPPEDDRGGGIQNYGNLVLNSSIVTGNFATDAGGGIMNEGPASLTLNNSQVNGNFSGSGGAIHNNNGGSVTLNNSQANGNSANFRAGGIRNSGAGSSLIIQNGSQVNNNSMTGGGGGGGITNDTGSVQILGGSSVSGNSNPNSVGGGIFNFGSGSLTVDASTLSDNSAARFGGGAIFATGATTTVTIQNGSLIGGATPNTADTGGGVFVDNGTLTIAGSTVSNNVAIRNATGWNQGIAGGVGVGLGGTAILSGVTITSNQAETQGGGLWVGGGATATLTDVTVTGNEAGRGGGGIGVLSGSSATISGGTISDNHVTTGLFVGGGLASNGSVTMDGTLISSNTATGWGGGLYFNGGSFNLTGITVNNNSAPNGGGVAVDDGAPINGSITSALIRGNTATDSGGGISMLGGTITVTDSRILSNTAGNEGGGYFHASGTSSVTNSCIVLNSDTAVFNNTAISQTFTGNWWGIASGPGPVGPGAGDTVSAAIDFSGFLTTPPSGCPKLKQGQPDEPAPAIQFSDPAISKLGLPVNASVGETVIWTITITNPGPNPTDNFVFVRDFIPDQFTIVNVTATRGAVTIIGQEVRVEIGVVQPGEVITITIETVVNGLGAEPAICNTASADWNFTITATDCVNVYPDQLPPTGGQPVRRVHVEWMALASLGIAALTVAAGVALRAHRPT